MFGLLKDAWWVRPTRLGLSLPGGLLLICLLGTTPALAEESSPNEQEESISESVRIYRNPEERREASLGKEITEWLKFGAVVELEKEWQKNINKGKNSSDHSGLEFAIETGLEVNYHDWLEAEILFEIENEGVQLSQELDEASVGVSLGDWEMKVGQLNVPFGAFYSYFGMGPLLEFGKVRGHAAVMEYTLLDSFELAAYIFDSKVDRRENHNEIDWGVNLEYVSEDESIHIGIGYLSDLGESKEKLLLDFNNNFLRRVPAWNVYALIGLPSVEITAEVLRAAKTFREFPENANQPFAYNLEVAYFPFEVLQIATRIEHSEELMDEPEWQYGISTTWAIFNNLTVTADYLYGRYKKQFVFDDFNNAQTAHHFTGLKLTWGF